MFSGIEGQSSTASIVDADNQLTSGRVNIWVNLMPEIAKSPLIGRGMTSSQWADFTRAGRYTSFHPHSLYLEILMDMGIVGAICMFIFYRYVWRTFSDLSRSSQVPQDLRGYFAGGLATIVGMLVYGISNGHYFPASEQVFFWVAFGLAIGYSRLAAANDKPRQEPVWSGRPATPPTAPGKRAAGRDIQPWGSRS